MNEVKPTYFLLENVLMGEKWEKVISKTMGVKPIQINSALLSAQNRQRLYWTNIGMQSSGLFGDLESVIKQPKDKGILLKDILQDNPNAIYYTLNDSKADNSKIDDKYYLTKNQVEKVLNKTGVDINTDEPKILDIYNKKIKEDGKCITLTEPHHNNMRLVEPKPVDEKYFLSEKMVDGFKRHAERHAEKGTGFGFNPKDGNQKANCLRANASLAPTDNMLKLPIPVDEKYFVDNLTENQIKKFNELNPNTDKSGCLTEAIARGGSSDEYMSMLKRNSIITHDIPQMVVVRKYEVDIENLQKCLKEHRKISVKKIAENLNVQKSKVEHWFRTDKSFAIPDSDYWMQLKQLLKIETDQFDQSIMEFEEREGTFEKTNRVYDEDGIAPTLTSTNADERILVRKKKEIKQINNTNLKSNGGTQPYQQDRIYDVDGISPALSANKSDLLINEEYFEANNSNNKEGLILAGNMRGGKWENTHESSRRVYDSVGKAPTIPTMQGGNQHPKTLNNSRIRKLTPLECERLQTVPDNYTNCVSDSQRYKMLGNGWTIEVISYIFSYIK